MYLVHLLYKKGRLVSSKFYMGYFQDLPVEQDQKVIKRWAINNNLKDVKLRIIFMNADNISSYY